MASGHVRDFTVFTSAQIAKTCNRRLRRGANPGNQEVEPGAHSIATARWAEQKPCVFKPSVTAALANKPLDFKGT